MSRRLAALLLTLALLVAGCGSDDSSGDAGSGSRPTLTVSAATSLKNALTSYGTAFDAATVRYSFAGSDELAAQIRQGVKPDVFASANTTLPDQLYKEGLVEKPQVFAGNTLVLAVPSEDAKVASLEDLAKSGVTLAVGSESVPVGSYTRKVLGRLPASERKAILANVRSEEPDVGGVVGKVAQGAVDAGFVYVTDIKGADGRLKAIDLPADLQPDVAYGVAVVKGAKQPAAAKAFIGGLLSGAGRDALDRAGFTNPGAAG